MVVTILVNLWESSARQLGKLATHGTICTQFMAQHYDREDPIQTPHGVHAYPSRPINAYQCPIIGG
jgi:hypothetical protein